MLCTTRGSRSVLTRLAAALALTLDFDVMSELAMPAQ